MWRKRQVLFIGPIILFEKNALPQITLTYVSGGKRTRGRLLRIAKHALTENPMSVTTNLDKREKV